MTTATAPVPPTRDAILEAITEQWVLDYSGSTCSDPAGELRGVIARMADPLVDSAVRTLEAGGASAWEALRADVGPAAIWQDLRPSEAVALMELVEAACDRAAVRSREIIEEELTAAGVAFAERYPDATRAPELVS